MAIQIKKLGTRSITAAVFVLVLLSGLLWNYFSFSILFFVVAMWGLYEFYKLAEKISTAPYKKVGFVIGALTYCAFINPQLLGLDISYNPLLSLLVAFPFVIFAVVLGDRQPNPAHNLFITFAGIIYAVLPFALLHELVAVHSPENNSVEVFFPYTLLGVILLIWCNDTFAYLGGSIFGKRKMVERISPGKTWEGTIIGVCVAFASSFLIAKLIHSESQLFWPVAGLLVPVLSTIGDLLESVLKRQAGLKDTGNLMPGHGGILDRFDSLIFVTPFVVVLLKVISLLYVSG